MKYIKKDALISWGALAVIVLFIYLQFSSGQFSFIFTLAGTVQTFGFALIVFKIRRSRSVAGLSRETFICYTLVFFLRSILFQFFRVHIPQYRATSLTTRQVISSSKSNKFSLPFSPPTFFTR